MPQQLPFPTSNNAPLPVPMGYGGNYSGMNFGSTTGQPFPTMPAFGSYSGPAYNAPTWSGAPGGGLASLSSGFAPYGQGYGTDFYNMLGRAYGKGTGQLLGNVIGGGLYNPQVAAAYLNAQQPGIARGEAGILGAFGNAGARYSSAAALGLGDYESQVQLNQQQMLAQMYQNAQQMQLSELNQVLPTIQQERANEGGWLNTALGIAETVAGAAMIPFSGGLSAPLIMGGLNSLSKGHGTPQGGGAVNPQMGNQWTPYGLPGMAGNTGTFGNAAPYYNPSTGALTDPQVAPTGYSLPVSMQMSGANLFSGGFDPGSGDVPLPVPFY